LNGVFGCEWFPVNYLSLFGEYSAYAVIGKSKVDDYTTVISTGELREKRNATSDDFELRANTVRLGLSLYF
jgi:hypothetical protein